MKIAKIRKNGRGKNRAKPSGRIKFYTDENIDMDLVHHLRYHHKVNISTAIEMGYASRDDHFQFQEAKRQGRFLLSSDMDFLKHKDFPFNQMLGIVILDIPQEQLGIGYMSLWLTEEIVPSGKEIERTKIVVHSHTLDIHWVNESGKICKQVLFYQDRGCHFS